MILLAGALTSCMTEKNLAQKCADRFPNTPTVEYVQGSTVYDTAYIPGDTLVFTDTIRMECDSARQVITVPIYQQKACPPVQVRTVSRVDTVVKTVENRAAVEAERLRAQDAEAKAERLQDGRDTWRNIAIPALCALLIVGVLKIKGTV